MARTMGITLLQSSQLIKTPPKYSISYNPSRDSPIKLLFLLSDLYVFINAAAKLIVN